MFRVIEAILGAALAGGGGYVAWMNRGSVEGMFPPEPGLSVWSFVGGLVGVIIGVVMFVHAVGPRPKAKAQRAEEMERRNEVLRNAEAFYTAQANELAGNNAGAQTSSAAPAPDPLFPDEPAETEPTNPAPAPDPVPEPTTSATPPEPFQLHSLNQPPPSAHPAPQPTAEAPPSEPLVTAPIEPEPTPDLAPVNPEPTPPAAAEPGEAPREQPFPSPPGRIPTASEPPPAPTAANGTAPASSASAASRPTMASPAGEVASNPELDAIRSAIAEDRLDEADQLLAEARKRLSAPGAATDPTDLARLTGLAGDHAAADGRLGSAKWLWRLALQRFAAAGAIDDPSARQVSERMRLADQ